MSVTSNTQIYQICTLKPINFKITPFCSSSCPHFQFPVELN
uniref:Uncharacterized protein n=1 Tax=Rhizophora mucronata TaxID=61149 RepID=A0A2P2PU06_RHIMU